MSRSGLKRDGPRIEEVEAKSMSLRAVTTVVEDLHRLIVGQGDRLDARVLRIHVAAHVLDRRQLLGLRRVIPVGALGKLRYGPSPAPDRRAPRRSPRHRLPSHHSRPAPRRSERAARRRVSGLGQAQPLGPRSISPASASKYSSTFLASGVLASCFMCFLYSACSAAAALVPGWNCSSNQVHGPSG